MISIVIPVFNERDSLTLLHDEIVESTRRAGLDCQIIFIDDGSTDGSWETITQFGLHIRQRSCNASVCMRASLDSFYGCVRWVARF